MEISSQHHMSGTRYPFRILAWSASASFVEHWQDLMQEILYRDCEIEDPVLRDIQDKLFHPVHIVDTLTG